MTHTTGGPFVCWEDRQVLLLLLRCHYKWAHGVPPARHGLLQPPAVRDGGELLPQVPGLLPCCPAAAGWGSLLHKALLPAGQLHSAQVEGRRAKWATSDWAILHNTLHVTKELEGQEKLFLINDWLTPPRTFSIQSFFSGWPWRNNYAKWKKKKDK